MISPWLSETSFGFTFPIATINTNNFMSKFIMGDAEKVASIAIRGSTAKRNKNPTPFVCCMLWNVIGDWYCEHSTNRSAGFSNKRLFYLNFDAMLHFSLLRFNFRSWHIATFLAINVGIVWASGQRLEKKNSKINDHGTLQSHIAPLTMSFSLSFEALSYLRIVFNTIK